MNVLTKFILGLILVSLICGILLLIENETKPLEVKLAEARATWFRDLPRELQYVMARQQNKSIEQLTKDPYSDWSPKVSIGLVSLYVYVYIAYLFGNFAKRQGRNPVRWITASIVLTPPLAIIAYLLTWTDTKQNTEFNNSA